PERRLPLRQSPSERSFSCSFRNTNPVRNGRVLPHLRHLLRIADISAIFSPDSVTNLYSHLTLPDSLQSPAEATKFVTCAVTFSVELRTFRSPFPFMNSRTHRISKKIFRRIFTS